MIHADPEFGNIPDHRMTEEDIKRALAEAERRGAERGWDEGWARGQALSRGKLPKDRLDPARQNPYRRPAVAPSEPAQQSGDHQDIPDTEKTGEAL